MKSIFSRLGPELLGLCVDVQVELVEGVGVGFSDEDDLRVGRGQANECLEK